MQQSFSWLVTLLWLLPVTAALTQETSAEQEDTRCYFRYGSGYFQQLDDPRWIERRDEGVTSHFEETDRTDRYIQLYDADRQLSVCPSRDRGETYDRPTRT